MDVLEIKNLNKTYKLYDRNIFDRFSDTFLPGKKKRFKDFHALKDINLTVKKGEILGIIGRNGAGKSTLLKVITGISQPSSGSVKVEGRIVALLELGGGFNPEYTGRENIYFNCALQGMTKEEIDSVYGEIVEFSELGEFIDVPVKTYSSGMRARLGFATSINIDPDILILDEVLSVGDELFRRKCFDRIKNLFDMGKTVIYVSHSLGSVKQLCSRAIFLHKGEMLISGTPEIVINQYYKLLRDGTDQKSEQVILGQIRRLQSDGNLLEKREEEIENRNLSDRLISVQSSADYKKAFFSEGFISKSRRIEKRKDIDIFAYSLKTIEGEKVNHLIWGEQYKFSFKAKFNEQVENLRFGIILYNEKNVEISSMFQPSAFVEPLLINMGEEKNFETLFSSFLSKGLYGIRLVVREIGENGEHPVSIISDAIIFKCSGKTSESGLVTLFDNGALF